MVFNFNFTFAVPGVPNPFTPLYPGQIENSSCAPSYSRASASPPRTAPSWVPVNNNNYNNGQARDSTHTFDRRSPSPLLTGPSSRKRGWQPSSSELSYPSTIQSSTGGYLDTPAKYREMAENRQGIDPTPAYTGREDDEDTEQPAPKRRRTLAGSVVSGVVSAALIGTAVGLTVYRLWRDRGRQPDHNSLPPPPYQESEWSEHQAVTAAASSGSPAISITAPTPRPRRRGHAAGRRTATVRHRKIQSSHSRMGSTHNSPPPANSSGNTFNTPAPSGPFDFTVAQQDAPEEDEADVEMDWIGDKISRLIEEGKKALNTGVVVQSEAKEDEVDDGSDAWEEELDPDASSASLARSGSMRRKRARGSSRASVNPIVPPPPSYSPGPSVPSSPTKQGYYSPVKPAFDRSSNSVYSARAHGYSTDSLVPSAPVWKEREEDYESSELKASMERARAAYKAKKQLH